MSSFFAIDQFLNDIIEIKDDGLVLLNHILHLLLPFLLLPFQPLYLGLLTLDDAPIEPNLHPCITLTHLHIRTAHLL